MHDEKMRIISELMEELQDMMGYSPDDLGERLGRKKPDVEVVSVSSEGPMEGMEEKLGMDLDGDQEAGEDAEHASEVMGGEMESPEEKLKQRLMKLRG